MGRCAWGQVAHARVFQESEGGRVETEARLGHADGTFRWVRIKMQRGKGGWEGGSGEEVRRKKRKGPTGMEEMWGGDDDRHGWLQGRGGERLHGVQSGGTRGGGGSHARMRFAICVIEDISGHKEEAVSNEGGGCWEASYLGEGGCVGESPDRSQEVPDPVRHVPGESLLGRRPAFCRTLSPSEQLSVAMATSHGTF